MKDIGETFKLKREEIGVKKSEVASDLNITIAQLDNLEDGCVNAFKDISFLKELVVKYSKYLNLDSDEILEKFNNFVFDFTSKIPVQKIEEKVKELNKEIHDERKKVVSPYTKSRSLKKKNTIVKYVIILLILLLLISFVIFISTYLIKK